MADGMLRRALPAVIALLLGQATGPARALDSAEAFLAQQLEQVRRELSQEGVVLISNLDEGDFIEALVIFDAPPERVMKLLMYTTRQREWRPELREIETVERFETGNVDRHEMRIMFVKIRYYLHNQWDPAGHRLRWTLAPGREHSLDSLEGFWQLYGFADGRTLGHFGTRTNVGAGVPRFVQDAAAARTVPATMERCRSWVNAESRR